MTFKEFLKESFLTGVKAGKRYVEIYKDPSSSDIDDIRKSIVKYNEGNLKPDGDDLLDSIRLGFDSDLILYAWNGNILHKTISDKLGKKFIIQIDFFKGSPDVSPNTGSFFKDENDVEIVKKKLKQAFPNNERIDSFVEKRL